MRRWIKSLPYVPPVARQIKLDGPLGTGTIKAAVADRGAHTGSSKKKRGQEPFVPSTWKAVDGKRFLAPFLLCSSMVDQPSSDQPLRYGRRLILVPFALEVAPVAWPDEGRRRGLAFLAEGIIRSDPQPAALILVADQGIPPCILYNGQMWGHGAHWDQTVGRSGACSIVDWPGRLVSHAQARGDHQGDRSALWEPWK
jgi:hypothetical protein